MDAQTYTIRSQGQTGRGRRSRSIDPALCSGQRGLSGPVRHCYQAPARSCAPVQPKKQRVLAGVIPLHVHETGMVICRPVDQSQKGTAGTRLDCGNRQGSQAQQGKLVCLDMDGAGFHRRAGNISAVISAWSLPSLGAAATGKCGAKIVGEKRIPLTVPRSAKPRYWTVPRSREYLNRTVPRSNEATFPIFPWTVPRSPSSNTTTYRESMEATQ